MIYKNASQATEPREILPFPMGFLSENDRDLISARASMNYSIDVRSAREILDDLVIFLSASVQYEYSVFSPCEKIDDIWHEFILHTHAYVKFCNSLGVMYIHHVPCNAEISEIEIPKGENILDILRRLKISFKEHYWNHNDVSCFGCDRGIQHWPSNKHAVTTDL